jgi:hypothetical protein
MSRTVEELRRLALFHKQTFHRTVSTEVYLTGEGALSVCKLLDNYHDMEMAMLVDRTTYEILDIAAIMHRHPFDSCVASFQSYKRLIGLRIMGGGVLHKVHQLIPREDGCTHLYTALEACLRALFIGAGYEEMGDLTQARTRNEEQEILRQHPLTKDTCVSFRTDGEQPLPAGEYLEILRQKATDDSGTA